MTHLGPNFIGNSGGTSFYRGDLGIFRLGGGGQSINSSKSHLTNLKFKNFPCGARVFPTLFHKFYLILITGKWEMRRIRIYNKSLQIMHYSFIMIGVGGATSVRLSYTLVCSHLHCWSCHSGDHLLSMLVCSGLSVIHGFMDI